MMPVVGYIGLGDMGGPVSARILNGGYPLVVWNRTAARMAPLLAQGAAAAESPADLAARCDVVFLCVDTPEACEEIIFGSAGLSAPDRRVRLVVDNSTLHPERARAIAARAAQAGLKYLDCPVSGGSQGARTGTLAVMIGGDDADVATVLPIARTFGRPTHMGGVGAGMATKMFNQILHFGIMLTISETMALAPRYGLAPELIPEALRGGFGDSVLLQEYARATAAREGGGVTWVIDQVRDLLSGRLNPEARGRMAVPLKDAAIALDVGRTYGVVLPVMGLFEQLHTTLHYQHPPVREDGGKEPATYPLARG